MISLKTYLLKCMDALQNTPYCYVDIYIGNVENFQFNIYEYIFIHLANMYKIYSVSTSRFLVEFYKVFIASVYGLVIAIIHTQTFTQFSRFILNLMLTYHCHHYLNSMHKEFVCECIFNYINLLDVMCYYSSNQHY
jgi:hypothetical protein